MCRLGWVPEAYILKGDFSLYIEIIGAIFVISDLRDAINNIKDDFAYYSCLDEGLNVGSKAEDHQHSSHERNENCQ